MTEESSPPTGVDVSRDEFMRERIMTAVKDESRQLDELVLFGRRDCKLGEGLLCLDLLGSYIKHPWRKLE